MWSHVCDSKLLSRLRTTDSSHTNRNWLVLILGIVLTTGVFALAGPSWQKQDYPLLESSAARVLILDLSQSMLVEDIKPSRLDNALDASRKIISADFDGETALVVFAGEAFTVSPLTRDANTLLEFIDALSPVTMPLDGSRLDLALDKATHLLAASITRTGQIFVITDGSSHFKQSASIAGEASRSGNRVSILVIGSLQGGPMKSSDGGLQRNDEGEFILAKPDFEQLESITRSGQGRFIKLGEFQWNIDSLLQEASASADLRTQDRETESLRKPENGGFWLVWLMLPLTLLLFRKNTLWLFIIAIAMPADREPYAMEFNELWLNSEQLAFEAYQKGNYDAARQLSENPYLTGAALFKLQDYAASIEIFSQENTARSIYNRGNAFAFQGKFEQALLAYRQALTLQPEFEDARYNQYLIESYLNNETGSDSDSSDQDDVDKDSEDPQDENSGQSRPGQISEIVDFRDQTDQPGIGASRSLDLADYNEEEDVSEINIQLEAFLRRIEAENFDPDPEMVKLWTDSLYTDPAELFKRKFLRDYLRNKQQSR